MSKKLALRVLIVDDNEDAATTLAVLAELWGHEVRTAFSAERALELAKEFKPNIVILDIGMPRMGGLTLAEHLRAEVDLQNCELIAVSGHTERSVQEKAKRLGIQEYLVKPADPDMLQRILQEWAKQLRHQPAVVGSV